jgi:hypothetical protein
VHIHIYEKNASSQEPTEEEENRLWAKSCNELEIEYKQSVRIQLDLANRVEDRQMTSRELL